MSAPDAPVVPDFLGRLVDRALNTGNDLAPMLPSLFEPTPEFSPFAPELPVETLAESDAEVQMPSSLPMARRRVSHAASRAEATDPGREGADIEIPMRSAVFERTEPETVAFNLESTAASAATPSRRLETEASVRRDGTLIPNAVRVPVLPEPYDEPGDTHRAAVSRGGAAVDPANSAAPTAAFLPVPIPHVVATPVFARRSKSPTLATETSAAPRERMPTISVTIGKVEVRSLPEPNRQRPRPLGREPMSLEEYFRNRGGGQ